MNLKRLNGWQRLWILLSATWLVVVVFGTITGYILPATRELNDQLEADKTEVNEFWVEATINVSFKPNPLIREIPDVEATRRDYSDLDDVTFVEQWQESHPDVNFGQVNADYEDAIQHLHITYQKDRERIVPRASGYGFLFWAVPSVLVYLLGWGVRWVWRGFKLKGDG